MKAGFTLVEAMVGMSLLTAITLALAGTFLIASKTLSNEARVISADTAVSHATFSLTRDLATATSLPTGTISRAGSVTLTYGSPSVTIVYSVDSSNELIRSVNGSALVAARGITSVAIAASGCYATATIQPSAGGASAVTLNVSNRPAGCL